MYEEQSAEGREQYYVWENKSGLMIGSIGFEGCMSIFYCSLPIHTKFGDQIVPGSDLELSLSLRNSSSFSSRLVEAQRPVVRMNRYWKTALQRGWTEISQTRTFLCWIEL